MASPPPGPGKASLEQVLEIVFLFFRGDRPKVDAWLRTPHAGLQGRQPMDVIRAGQPELLLEVIKNEIARAEQAAKR
ncbi:MAG: DUF2384 domain-containing protein [Candidatus Lambdaproteobacteria bacterium]|nr:DUF2384 domain-containing protein [Candidatus Lambdaproteobacteria bacterium]